MRRPVVAAAVLVVLASSGVAFARLHSGSGEVVAVVEEAAAPERTPEPLLVIDVAGAVAQPGVYRLPGGARVADALAAAGGMSADADPFALNKAAPVRDGQRVYVPRHGETIAPSPGGEPQLKIDLNRATPAELETLPGIGPSTAAKIVRSRGGRLFARVEELQTRGLVSARVFADIRDLVTTR
jgi:competence protein ComEA